MEQRSDTQEKAESRTAGESSLSRRSYLWTVAGAIVAASSTTEAAASDGSAIPMDTAARATGTNAADAYGFGGRPVPKRTGAHLPPREGVRGANSDGITPARTAASASDRLWVEAETAADGTEFAPFETAADDGASGRTFVHVPDGTGANYDSVPDRGHAAYPIEVPADGEYAIWGRIRPESNGNSFYASIGGETYYWEVRPVDDEWGWVRLNDGASNPIAPSLSAGERTLEVIWREDGTDLDKLLVTSDLDFTPTGTGGDPLPKQAPYGGTARELPGRIQAEDFDAGGEGVAYHDRDERNSGGAYRTSGVDIQPAADTSGEYNVGWMEDGEWLEYTVSIPPGTYDIEARVASIAGGNRLGIALGEETLGILEVPDTGDWQAWRTISLSDVSVPDGGTQVLRLVIDTDDRYAFNLNWIEFARTQSAYGGSAPELPGRIQAEDYDEGGEGVAYRDADSSNDGGAYRDDGVDIQRARDDGGGYNVGWMEDGEWLEYSVSVPADSYDIAVRVASPNSGGRLRLTLDGEVLGTVSVPNTGGWQDWTTVTIPDVSVAEGDLLHLEVDTDDRYAFNLNWIAFTAPEEGEDPDYGVQGYGEYGYGGVEAGT